MFRFTKNSLAIAWGGYHFDHTMKRSSSRWIFTLALGILLAIGLAASAVQAGQMTLDPATSDCMSAMELDCCGDCDGDDERVSVGACLSICSSGACAVMVSVIVPKMMDQPRLSASARRFSQNRVASPEPHPPRPFYLI